LALGIFSSRFSLYLIVLKEIPDLERIRLGKAIFCRKDLDRELRLVLLNLWLLETFSER